MTAPLPVFYTGNYLTKQPDAGLPGGPSVFDALANPPSTGVAAETAVENDAIAVGVDVPNSPARLNQCRNRDSIVDFYDTASILIPVEEET